MRRCSNCAAEVDDAATTCVRCGRRVSSADAATAVRIAMPSDAESNAATQLEGSPAVIARDPDAGRVVGGRYEIVELIGTGGMGRVYKVRHVELDTLLCLKKLKPELSDRSQADTLMQRFRAEAKLTSRLNHPNIIKVVDFGADSDGALYYVMEYVEGRDLDELLTKEHALSDERLLRIIEQVLDALAEAHAQRVVHRDLKPKNVMIERRRGEADFVRVLDFGIAKLLGESKLTQTGHIVGTAHYMSPEQAMGHAIDQRSDLYAVGVMLYELATGSLPYDAETPTAVLFQHVNLPTPSPRARRPDIPDRLEKLIYRALEKEPKKRPQTAEEFRDEVRAILAQVRSGPPQRARARPGKAGGTQLITHVEGPPPQPAWVKPAVIGGVVALAAIAAILFVSREQAPVPQPAVVPPTPVAVAPPAPAPAVVAVAPPIAPRPVQGGPEVVKKVSPPPKEVPQPSVSVPIAPPQKPVEVVAPVKDPPAPPVVVTPVEPPSPVTALNARMVRVAAAKASPIGCAVEEEDCSEDEKPRIEADVKAFSIDRYEVSLEDYDLCVTAGLCTRDSTGAGCRPLDKSEIPVNCVNWEQANQFCRWRGARLPTEFEWERAARGDSDRRYPWGNEDPDCTRAQFSSGELCPDGGAMDRRAHPKGASPFGVQDLAGNLKEWTADWYHPKTYTMGAPPKIGEKKVVRGGSFENGPDKLRVTYRIGHAPGKAFASVGFRCVK